MGTIGVEQYGQEALGSAATGLSAVSGAGEESAGGSAGWPNKRRKRLTAASYAGDQPQDGPGRPPLPWRPDLLPTLASHEPHIQAERSENLKDDCDDGHPSVKAPARTMATAAQRVFPSKAIPVAI